MNRGVAIFGNTLYMATIDAHLIAVNASDGKLLWDKEIAKPEAGYAMTHAPLVIKGKVIVGVAGAEFSIRGFLEGYDVATGKHLWRHYTVPAAGEYAKVPGTDAVASSCAALASHFHRESVPARASARLPESMACSRAPARRAASRAIRRRC